MYNGIGLGSVRGTATSGHVQANRSHVRGSRLRYQRDKNVSQRPREFNPVSSYAREEGNLEIQRHAEQRSLESRLLELREELEEFGYRKEEIDQRVEEERRRQERLWNVDGPDRVWGKKRSNNDHVEAQRKREENERVANAFGIHHTHVEGEAFDRELREQQRQ